MSFSLKRTRDSNSPERGPAAAALQPSAKERPAQPPSAAEREAITFYQPIDDREADRAPLSAQLIRRLFTYTRPYKVRRNWLFVLTFARGLQLPALAWMIGKTINGPIAGQDLQGIFIHTLAYFLLVIAMVLTLHWRQRFALELGEGVAHDMRSQSFCKAGLIAMSFFTKTKFGRIRRRTTAEID